MVKLIATTHFGINSKYYARVYEGKLLVGTCLHHHRTQEAAAKCAAKIRRDLERAIQTKAND